VGVGAQGEAGGEVASIPLTVFTSTPFWRARVAKVWRRSWNRTLGRPARFSTRWSICRTLSGDMGPPVGDGKTQGLFPAFFFCSFRTATVPSASGRVR